MNQRKYQEAGVEEREKHAMIERQHGSLAELQRKILKTCFTVSGKTECHIQTSRSQGLLYSEGAGIFRAAAEPPAGAVPDPSPQGLRNKKIKYRPSCS